MFRGLKEIIGYRILATDGEIGTVNDFYFNDQPWKVRYVVVDTGNWLPARKVLLSSVAIGEPERRESVLPVRLSAEEVEGSPSIENDTSISRWHERDLHDHYGWMSSRPPAGTVPGGVIGIGTSSAPPVPVSPREQVAPKPTGDDGSDLKSIKEIAGYPVYAADGDMGRVHDLIADSDDWTVRYIVVDTHHWLSGRKVLVSPAWIDDVDWNGQKLGLQLSRDEIRQSPLYDPLQPVDREYETRLYDYYGRPAYWEQ